MIENPILTAPRATEAACLRARLDTTTGGGVKHGASGGGRAPGQASHGVIEGAAVARALTLARPQHRLIAFEADQPPGPALITEHQHAGAGLFLGQADMGVVDRAKAAGVFAYLVKPFKPSDLPPSIEVARSRFEQNLQLTKEVGTLQERLEARKLVDRAKGILMDEHKLTEGEAYRRIQVQSMNLRKTMREVAEAIILAKSI